MQSPIDLERQQKWKSLGILETGGDIQGIVTVPPENLRIWYMNLGSIELNIRRLSEFLAVIEKGSIGGAAKFLNKSQPALSKNIHKLEEEIGVPLFTRMPRGVQPTIYGKILSKCAVSMTLNIDKALIEIQSLYEGSSGTVYAAAGADWLLQVAPTAIVNLHSNKPDICVRMSTGHNTDLYEMLEAGEIDFCLTSLPTKEFDPIYTFDCWVTDTLQIIASRDHPAHQIDNLKLSDLLSFQWALPIDSGVLSERMEDLFYENQLSAPKPSLASNEASLLHNLIEKHGYLGWSTELRLQSGHYPNLLPLKISGVSVMRKAGLVKQRGKTLNQSAEAFILELKKACIKEFPHCNTES